MRMDAACVTQATPALCVPPAPAQLTAGVAGAVFKECAYATRAMAVRIVGRKSLPPVLAQGAAGPGNYAAQVNVCVLRASEALTALSRYALETVVAVESVARVAASAKMAMPGRTVGKVSGQSSSICLGKDWDSRNKSHQENLILKPRVPKTWREMG